jgi:hypothetical protein
MTTASRLANHSTRAERVALFEGPDTYEQASAMSRLPMIEKRIRQKLGTDFRIELREVRELEKSSRGKHRWLVSRVTSK